MAEEFVAIEDRSDKVQPAREQIKHLLIGSPQAVKRTIQILHVQGYSEVGFWSKPVPAGDLGRSGEVVSVMIKQI